MAEECPGTATVVEKSSSRRIRSDSNVVGSHEAEFDPMHRKSELEEDLFRLKFERARLMENEQVAELTDRRNREDIEVLKEKLWQIHKAIRGEDIGERAAERSESDAGLRGRKVKLSSMKEMVRGEYSTGIFVL